MPVTSEITLVCNYCSVATKKVKLNSLNGLGGWFVLSPAQDISPSLSEGSIVICRKCKLHIDELGRIARYFLDKKINPPPPDDLLPEEDLPDSSFIGDIANPDIACIGTPRNLYGDTLPDAMKVKNPLWIKKPVVKRKNKNGTEKRTAK